MAQSDVYQVTMHYEVNGKKCYNIFFYQSLDDLSQAPEMVLEFVNVVRSWLLVTQPTDIQHNYVEAINIFNPVDRFRDSTQDFGEDATNADYLPEWTALAIKFTPSNSNVRPGGKRISGWKEHQITSYGEVSPAAVNAFETLAVLLETPLDDTTHLIITAFVPIIVGRILDGLGYRLPDDQLEMFTRGFAFIANAIVEGYTTQTTRKD